MNYKIEIEESLVSNNGSGVFVTIEIFNKILDIEQLFKIKDSGLYL